MTGDHLSTINRYKKAIKNLSALLFEGYFHAIARTYDIGRYDRIYFYHIPKTSGTSIIHMFLLLGVSDPASLYQKLTKRNRVLANGKIFVG